MAGTVKSGGTAGGGLAADEAALSAENSATLRAYGIMTRFLTAFLEHAIKDLDYTIKDKRYVETMFDMEMTDSEDRTIFYNDSENLFTAALLYGAELTLSMFELLLFCFVDLLAADVILAACTVYCSVKVLTAVRYHFGRLNLANKTLVDERFLI